MYTQCPDCQIAFRVTAKVLQQASGRVQCGSCSHTFNAVDHLSEMPPEPDVVIETTAEDSVDAAETSFEERNTQLLKTLDELAGPDEVRIEDTGIEWRVLNSGVESDNVAGNDETDADDMASVNWYIDDDEDDSSEKVPADETGDASAGDPAIEPQTTPGSAAKASAEPRYDDSTPLPDDFEDDDIDSSPPDAPLPRTVDDPVEDDARKNGEPKDDEPNELDDDQVGLALGDPDEWIDLLEEVADEETDDQDVVSESAPDERLDETGSVELPMETEEELAAIHTAITASAPVEPGPQYGHIDSTSANDSLARGDTGDGVDDEDLVVDYPDDDEEPEAEDAVEEELARADEDSNQDDDEFPAIDDGQVDSESMSEDSDGSDEDDEKPDSEISDEEISDSADEDSDEDDDLVDSEYDSEDSDGTDEHDEEPDSGNPDEETDEDENQTSAASHTDSDFKQQLSLIEDSLALEAANEDDSKPEDFENDDDALADSLEDISEHEIELELASSENEAVTAHAQNDANQHTVNIKVQEDMQRAMDDEKFAATMTSEDGSPLIETIIMEGDFVRGSLDMESAEPEIKPPVDLAEPKSLIDTYVLNRRGGKGGRFAAFSGGSMITGVIILLLVLIAQYVHSSREYLATFGAFNQTIGPVYRVMGNAVTPAWNIKGWQFETTNGSTDENEQQLTIRSRISNRSDQALPYPLVHVSLTDRWEEIVASRVLEPSEYLTGNPDPRKPVAAGEKFTAVITLATPPPEVTGFKLNVCYRVAAGRLSCATEDFK